jgi:hypothetical protein
MMKLKYFNFSLSPIMLISIVVISAAMHFKHFDKDLMGMHVWRQTQTQSNIISFYEEDMNIFNPRRNDRGSGDGISRLEFPLMQWLVAGTYKIFGNHLLITRIWMFLIGVMSVFGLYKLLKVLFDDEVPALMGAWAFNFSPSFYYYTINPMPDNLALCFSTWGIFMFILWFKKGKGYALPASGLLLAAGALSKLPFVLYFVVPLTWFLVEAIKGKEWGNWLKKTTGVSAFMLLPLAWYITVVPQWQGNGIVQGMFDNKVPASVLMDNFQHHLFITLPEMLLNYGSVIFFLAGFYFIIKNKAYKHRLFPVFASWGLVLIFYFLFELNMIGKSHDYYFFPFFPVLFILTAYGTYHLFMNSSGFIKAFVILLLLILPLTAWLRIDKRWDPDKPGFNRDLLVYKNELMEAVPKDALCIAGNDISHFIFFYYIDKKGWAFDNDNLAGDQLIQMIKAGAEYLYSDSRKVENNSGIDVFLDEIVLEKGSIRVYRLKRGFQP